MPKIPTSLSRPGAAAALVRTAPAGRHGGETVGRGAPDAAVRGDGFRRAVEERLGSATSARELSRKAQFVDYESMRAMFEAWNTRMWRGAGALPAALPHPALHTPVWPVCGHGLDVGGGYYGARKGCEPLHVQADPADGTVLAANHTAAAVPGAVVEARLYDLGGRPIGEPSRHTADLPAGGVTAAFAVPFARALPATHLLRLRLTGADGRLLSANDYWRCRTLRTCARSTACRTYPCRSPCARPVRRRSPRRWPTPAVRPPRWCASRWPRRPTGPRCPHWPTTTACGCCPASPARSRCAGGPVTTRADVRPWWRRRTTRCRPPPEAGGAHALL
ncbi:hypothetical protein NYE86_14905 [Actinacidiphila bryophytorum]|nr:hypothetical protein [Actinacidiphila bryophytorum]UWE09871.1 hypothetical protein NYE86_14905 [Actinacidiphila bryophytorum]